MRIFVAGDGGRRPSDHDRFCPGATGKNLPVSDGLVPHGPIVNRGDILATHTASGAGLLRSHGLLWRVPVTDPASPTNGRHRRFNLRRRTRAVPDELEDLMQECLLAVHLHLGAPPEGQRNPIVLTKTEGLSIAEASGRTGASSAANKVQVHRGLKRMAALILASRREPSLSFVAVWYCVGIGLAALLGAVLGPRTLRW